MRDVELTSRARAMRTQMTKPETRLWLQLRAERFGGVKFRRQKAIQDERHRYIVDFAANDPKLVVELDGDTHAGTAAYDAARTLFLKGKGYRVLRYTNLEVMQNRDGVLQHLALVIDEMRPPLPTLSPGSEADPEGQRERALGGATGSLSPEGERAFSSLSPSGERVGERGTS